jgi:autotransporter translocation and assembly factor TamB
VTAIRRLRTVSTAVARALIGFVAFILILVAIGMAVVETGWAKNRLRDLIVRQANQYLTATLSIGSLGGSLFRGLELGDITVARDGRTLVRVERIELAYSIRELYEKGTTIRHVRLTRPHVVGAKMADGRWDLGALVKRESREEERTGPGRAITIQSIEVVDGRVSLQDPLDFGAAHVPTDFESLNASFSFAYVPVRWTLLFNHVSWTGHAPDLSVNPLSGTLGRGPGGWFFENFSVRTARSAFTLDGRVNNAAKPTALDLRVHAPRFAFQEWGGVIRGLRNIAIDASFDTSLKGPVDKLETDLRFTGTGGSIAGRLTLDTTVPGWHAAGAVDVGRLDLARWLNRKERPSDITGHVTFNLALELGRRFPRGMYTFEGPHAMYMNYVGDNIRARGQITATEVLVAEAVAVAYGANVTTREGSIGIDEPFPFHFRGTTNGVDLRRVPATVPVPHVESVLALDYDVTGRFSDPFIVGGATFGQSVFLGATVGAGTVGTIDTQQKPLRYSGSGEVDGINLHRFGEGLQVGWLQDPRYAGTVSGHFHVDGSGTSAATLALTGGGRLTSADLFKGTLSDADVSIGIEGGTLRASYDGRLATIDPAVPFADPRVAASLTGTGTVTATVRDLLTRTTTLEDYDVSGGLTLVRSTIRDFQLDAASVTATLRDANVRVTQLDLRGPAIDAHGQGTVAWDATASDFEYDITRADLAQLPSLIGRDVSGTLSTKGRISGPSTALRAAGEATVTQLDGFAVNALTLTGQYDVTVPSNDIARATARVDGHAAFLQLSGQSIQDAKGTVTYDAQRLGFDVQIVQRQGRNGQLAGAVLLRPDRREASLLDLTVTLGRAPWRLAPGSAPPIVSWSDEGLAVTPLAFVDPANDARIGLSGTWRNDGTGALRVTATHLFLDALQTAFERPTRYAGILDADATIRGTRDKPQASGTLTIVDGRVERVSYQKLAGRFAYDAQSFDVDLRLDQSPGVWITAAGKLPLGLFDADLPEQPIDVAIKSSTISLGLIEGVTDVVRKVTGELQVDMKAIGTSRDPHFAGSIAIANAGFLAVASGMTYKNARAALTVASDRINVDALHLEDSDGHPIDVHGSLGTHELRVGEVEIEATARHFEVMRNALGSIAIDATLQLGGRFDAPRVAGDITINSGTLQIDEILARTLFQPYATRETSIADLDAVAALNPWDRLGLDVTLHVPGTLRLVGDNVQISAGTPVGLGDVNLRLLGDLYLYKDPAQPISVTGSFDGISGTYAFQGRRFDVLDGSSINFRGDLNPEVYVTVTRVISGVETRVSIFGPLRQPELRLASIPPLDESDILSLIVFNTSTNLLSAAQQQNLLVRAGTLAAGFLATPILSAIEKETGLDILEIEAPNDPGSTGPKITIGDEIAPGLTARFSRQFGQEPYDEATVEYALSRLLRIRATFSDAQSLVARSPFRRVERAGIDLLLFFSY